MGFNPNAGPLLYENQTLNSVVINGNRRSGMVALDMVFTASRPPTSPPLPVSYPPACLLIEQHWPQSPSFREKRVLMRHLMFI